MPDVENGSLEKMKIIELACETHTIQIDITDLNWVKCSLIDNDKAIYLGAEHGKYLKDHLLLALESKLQKVGGEINGVAYSWVLSLAEAHHVLYMSKNEEHKLFLWQDKDAKTVCIIRLSKDQHQQWLNQIISIPI